MNMKKHLVAFMFLSLIFTACASQSANQRLCYDNVFQGGCNSKVQSSTNTNEPMENVTTMTWDDGWMDDTDK